MMDLYSAEEWKRLYKHIVIVYTQFNVSPLSFIYMQSILVDAVFFYPQNERVHAAPHQLFNRADPHLLLGLVVFHDVPDVGSKFVHRRSNDCNRLGTGTLFRVWHHHNR